MRQADPAGIARRLVEIEPEACPFGQLDRPGDESSNPDFRPLQIGHDADGPAHFPFDRADRADARALILAAAMAEIDPEHVGAGIVERENGLAVAARRAQRGDDLGIGA